MNNLDSYQKDMLNNIQQDKSITMYPRIGKTTIHNLLKEITPPDDNYSFRCILRPLKAEDFNA